MSWAAGVRRGLTPGGFGECEGLLPPDRLRRCRKRPRSPPAHQAAIRPCNRLQQKGDAAVPFLFYSGECGLSIFKNDADDRCKPSNHRHGHLVNMRSPPLTIGQLGAACNDGRSSSRNVDADRIHQQEIGCPFQAHLVDTRRCFAHGKAEMPPVTRIQLFALRPEKVQQLANSTPCRPYQRQRPPDPAVRGRAGCRPHELVLAVIWQRSGPARW